MATLVNRMEAHIEELLSQHSIVVEWRKNARGTAYVRKRRIVVKPVASQITYVTCLHEIGHIVNRHSGLRVERETDAWAWARANTAVPLTPATHRAILRYLHSYLARQRRNGQWTCKLPPLYSRFWLVYRAMLRDAGTEPIERSSYWLTELEALVTAS